MKRRIKNILLIAALVVGFSSPAFGSNWELSISAITATGAENRISLGQRASATDGFDGRYDVPAYLEGDLSAYFPHPEWYEEAVYYWRDIKAADPEKSWGFKVSSTIGATLISFSWDSSRFPSGYTATLLDLTSGATVDMTVFEAYSYTNSGTRSFTVSTVAPEPPAAAPVATHLKAPSHLGGSVTDSTTVELTWQDNSEDEDGFIVERKAGPRGAWVVVATVGSEVTAYTDSSVNFTSSDATLTPLRSAGRVATAIMRSLGGMYSYRVKAYSGAVESNYSNKKVFISK